MNMTSSKWLVVAVFFAGLMMLLNLVVPGLPERLLDQASAQDRATEKGDYIVASAKTSSSVQLM